MSHAVRARWPRVCSLYYRCTALSSSTESGAGGGGGDAMMTDSGEGHSVSMRPGAQELADELLLAAPQDMAGAAWDGLDMSPDPMDFDANGVKHSHSDNGNGCEVVDRVYNSHKLKNKRGTYRNCTVQ